MDASYIYVVTNFNAGRREAAWRTKVRRHERSTRTLMETDGTAANQGLSEEPSLPDLYRALNNRRVDIDRRMAVLPPDDPARDVLWQDLEHVLADLRKVVGRLTNTPATQLSEMRAKANVLATLLRSGGDGGGPVIPENERLALTLSLIDDIGRLLDP
jgi:hypothetical protein